MSILSCVWQPIDWPWIQMVPLQSPPTESPPTPADAGWSRFISPWCLALTSVFHDRLTFTSKTLLAASTSVPPSSWISSFQSDSTFSTQGRCWIPPPPTPKQRHFHICSDLNLHVCTSANMFLSVFKISLLTLHNVLWWSLRKQDCRCFMFKQKCDGARLQLGLSYALVPSFPFFNAFNHLSLKWKILKRTIFAMYCKIRFPHDTFFSYFSQPVSLQK